MSLFLPGRARIKVYSASDLLTLQKTLYLPPPDAGDGVTLEFAEKSFKNDLVDGSERTRRLGWIPVLTLKWKVYNDTAGQGLTVGSADGNLLGITDLLTILSLDAARLKVSPGPAAGGFQVDSVKTSGLGIAGLQGFGAGVSVTFRGRSIQADQALGTF